MKLIRYEYPQNTASNAFNRLFDLGAPSLERFGSFFDDFFGESAVSRQPAVDLYEDAHNYYARLELPGVKKDSIDLELENSVLTIQRETTEQSKEGEAQYSFSRSISIPEGVDLAKIEASHQDGVLTVTLPKEAARKPRQITVK